MNKGKHKTSAFVILVLSLITYLFSIFLQPITNVIAEYIPKQDYSINVDYRNFVLDIELQKAVKDSLVMQKSKLIDGTNFAVTNSTYGQNEVLISIASLNGKGFSEEYIGIGDLSSLIVGKRNKSGVWEVSILGDKGFNLLISTFEDSFISKSNKEKIASISSNIQSYSPDIEILPKVGAQNMITTSGYKFPWPQNTEPLWGYWQGWMHGNDTCPGTVCAIDLGTTNNDKRISAATSGTVKSICTGQLTKNITVVGDDGVTLQYYHIDKNTFPSNITEASRINQGQILGSLKNGSFGPVSIEGCGYAVQSSTSAHLHLIIPKNVNLVMDGWSIQFPNNYWIKGDVQVYPSYNLAPFLSTNIPNASLAESKQSQVFADFNGDSRTDMIVTNATGSYWYLSNGNGTWTSIYTRYDWTLGNVKYVVGNFDGDSAKKSDMVIITPTGSYWYANYNSGNWSGIYTRTDWTLGNIDITTGNFDGDAKSDMILTTPGGSYWYSNYSNGNWSGIYTRTDWKLNSVKFTTGNFDGDLGKKDDTIITTTTGSYWYANHTNGNWTGIYTRPDWTLGNVGYTTGNFDGDPKMDMIISTTSSTYWYTNYMIGMLIMPIIIGVVYTHVQTGR